MRKIVYSLVGAGVIIVAGFFIFNAYIYSEEQKDETVVQDYKNGWYLISGQWVHLENGVSKVPIENSSATITTQYFGNEVHADFDGDGDEDVAFILTQDGGGSGIFFYLVGALKEPQGYRGTNAVLIGDRIAPQTTEFRDGTVIVNYADRELGEAFAVAPHIGKSLYLKYDSVSNSFGEVVQNFEGESNVPLKRLTAHLNETVSAFGVSVTPKEVLEDSRCPVDAVCVWEGRVRISATVVSEIAASTQEFVLREPVVFEGEEVTLLGVTPDARTGAELKGGDYVFTFEIKKR